MTLNDRTITIAHAETDAEIEATFEVLQQLWKDLCPDGYCDMIRALMSSSGTRLVALMEDGIVRAVATYRLVSMIFTGKSLHVDDLVTDSRARSQGLGARLLEEIEREGIRLECQDVQLISRTDRDRAHRFYFRQGYAIKYFHFHKAEPPRESRRLVGVSHAAMASSRGC